MNPQHYNPTILFDTPKEKLKETTAFKHIKSSIMNADCNAIRV